jgi:hypothetical protein
VVRHGVPARSELVKVADSQSRGIVRPIGVPGRTFALHLDLKTAAEPITGPHLVLDTGRTPLDKGVRRCLEYLEGG